MKKRSVLAYSDCVADQKGGESRDQNNIFMNSLIPRERAFTLQKSA